MKAFPLTALVLLLAGCAPSDPSGESPSSDPAEEAPSLDHVEAPQSQDGTQDAWARCLEQRNAVLRELAELARVRAGGCETDADCTAVLLELPCQRNCEAPVASAKAEELKASLSAYAAEVCPSLPTSCDMGPSCARFTPVCRAGTCQARF